MKNMRQKKWIVLIIILFVAAFFCSCSNRGGEADSSWISFTACYTEDAKVCYGVYIPDANTIEEVLIADDTAQYPLGIVDLKARKVYFSYRVGKADQLMEYDMDSKKVTPLTADFFAINKLLLVDENLFCLASTTERPKPGLVKYSLEKREYTFLSEESDAVVDISYAKGKHAIYYAAYDWKAELNNINEYNQHAQNREEYPKLKTEPYYIRMASTNTGGIYEVGSIDQTISVLEVNDDGTRMLVRMAKDYDTPKCTYELILPAMEIAREILPDKLLRADGLVYTEDKEGCYIAGTFADDEFKGDYNDIVFYDFRTDEYRKLVGYDDRYINNIWYSKE